MQQNTVCLADVRTGQKARFIGSSGGFNLEKRLKDMGLSNSEYMTVIKNDGSGPLILEVRGSNIVLGRGLSRKLVMEVLDEGA